MIFTEITLFIEFIVFSALLQPHPRLTVIKVAVGTNVRVYSMFIFENCEPERFLRSIICVKSKTYSSGKWHSKPPSLYRYYGLRMTATPLCEQTGLFLRDFFWASNVDDMKKAWLSAQLLNPELFPDICSLSPDVWQEAEYDFNALFIGPGPLGAPPWASNYLDENKLVMGETTLEVRRFMYQIGLQSGSENILPDDHISSEIELAVLLLGQIRHSPSEYIGIFSRFYSGHLMLWVPEFIHCILLNSKTTILRRTAEVLKKWLEEINVKEQS